MALPKKVLVDLELLVDLFAYLNKLGDEEGDRLSDRLLWKFESILRREEYTQRIQAEKEAALAEWFAAIDAEKKEEQ